MRRVAQAGEVHIISVPVALPGRVFSDHAVWQRRGAARRHSLRPCVGHGTRLSGKTRAGRFLGVDQSGHVARGVKNVVGLISVDLARHGRLPVWRRWPGVLGSCWHRRDAGPSDQWLGNWRRQTATADGDELLSGRGQIGRQPPNRIRCESVKRRTLETLLVSHETRKVASANLGKPARRRSGAARLMRSNARPRASKGLSDRGNTGACVL